MSSIEERLDRIERALVLNTKNVLDTKDLSLVLGVTENHIRVMCSKKEIPYYKRGASVFFRRSETEEWQLRDRVPTQEEIKLQASTYAATHRRKMIQA